VQASVPKTVNQLQSFLGLVNYYRCFVPGASSILTPLYDLLKKGAKWRWSKAENDACLEIKRKLTSDQILTHFNQNDVCYYYALYLTCVCANPEICQINVSALNGRLVFYCILFIGDE
jgi:hypothetical protein